MHHFQLINPQKPYIQRCSLPYADIVQYLICFATKDTAFYPHNYTNKRLSSADLTSFLKTPPTFFQLPQFRHG